jgi:hypothetical protein
MVALLEGVFDKEKLIPALQKSKKISTRPKNVGKLEVYDLLGDDGKLEGHGCLLSYEQALLGTGDAFNAALKLLEGGESVTANPDLKEISGDFGAKGLLWAAVQLRPEVLAAMKQNFPPEGPPFPELRGFLLGLDRSGDDGIAIAADVHCPSPEEAKKTQGFLGPMLAMYKMSMPEPVKAILDKVKLATAGKAVKLSLDLSGDDLEQLKGMAGMMAGAPPPGAVPVEAEEEEETDEAAPAEEPDAKAKEEPAAEEEPVKEEPEEPPAEEPPAKKVPAKGKKK